MKEERVRAQLDSRDIVRHQAGGGLRLSLEAYTIRWHGHRMHNPFDQLAKKVGKEALSACGLTIAQYEISRDAQYADLRHEPDPARDAERRQLGLLGRVAEHLCLINVYAHAPTPEELRISLGLHFSHWQEIVAKGRTRNKRRKERGLAPEPVAEPFLWVLAADFSAPTLRKIDAKAAAGWPTGIYTVGDDVFRLGIVVADELPRNRSTLLVRIMAAGRGLADALADLAALPADAHERTVAEHILAHMQIVLAKKPSRSPEEEEFIATMQSTWEKAKKIGRDEGKAEANAHAVLAVLRVRGLTVSEADRGRILAERDLERLERWHERAIVAASIAEVFNERSRT